MFFLNRTTRSGIASGGVIGGMNQDAKDKVGARFNKQDLVRRIRMISEYRERIHLTNLDAAEYLSQLKGVLPSKSLIYLDPPYFVKGGELYRNHYRYDDHAEIAAIVSELGLPWIVSYDDVREIRDLYRSFRHREYLLNYSAAKIQTGSEIMFFSDWLTPPYGINRYLAVT